MCMGNKFLSNIKITGTLNVQNTSHNVNKLSQNKEYVNNNLDKNVR